MVVQFIVFLTLSTLICRGTDISKCFSESLGIWDNESRLYSIWYYTYPYLLQQSLLEHSIHFVIHPETFLQKYITSVKIPKHMWLNMWVTCWCGIGLFKTRHFQLNWIFIAYFLKQPCWFYSVVFNASKPHIQTMTICKHWKFWWDCL